MPETVRVPMGPGRDALVELSSSTMEDGSKARCTYNGVVIEECGVDNHSALTAAVRRLLKLS